MTMGTLVVGVGQEVAGDDGVGLAVLDELRRRRVPAGTQLVHLKESMDLIDLLDRQEHVVLVDAVLALPPGVVVELSPEELSDRAAQPASSHGMGAAQAILLARTLSPGATPRVRVVAVTISRPDRYGVGLSPEVAAAVPEAADRVLSLLEVDHA
jgi:hydrogenase maturation protease